MAVQLDLLAIPYVVLERRSEPGGVWSINRYPDVRVDTASITYEFPFVKDHSWSEYFGRGAEVRDYIAAVSRRFGVYEKTRFGCDVQRAVFDEARDLWRLQLDTPCGAKTLEVNAVVSCSGLFATPNIPPFEGREAFPGPIVHPSQWPHDLDLAGKRVAVLGNGSTGVQILASIARQAAQVYVLQRTPQWIMPRANYGKAVEPELNWLLKNFPGYWNWWRFTSTAPLFDTHDLMQADAAWQARGGKVNPRSDAVRETLCAYIAEQVGGDADLIARLTPDYAPFSRRPVVDNGWYRALTRDNVELVASSVARLTPQGLETAGGRLLEVDLLVCATGFQVAKYLWPTQYIGKGGVDLHARWESGDGPRAYIGMMSPDFPNFFTLYGPNSQPISGGPAQPVWFAVWAGFVAQGLMRMLQTGASRIEVRRDAHDRYNVALDQAAAKLVQMTPAGGVDKNYYVNAEHARLQVNAPWYSPEYHRLCTQIAWDDLILSGRPPTSAEPA
jgi:4-hydroxyacetophenone monooxygenase